MGRATSGVAACGLGSLWGGAGVSGLPDSALIGRYLDGPAGESGAAFAAIVARHGPAVLAACRSALGADRAGADDAFQATFLVLARRAATIRDRDALGAWLAGVSRRVAGRARLESRRRRGREARAAASRGSEAGPPAAGHPELIEEVDALPDRDRAAVRLCYLDGLTHDEAARRLAWPVGTVRSRLARARARLRDRLSRRGLAPAALAAVPGRSTPSTVLIDETTRAALAFAARAAAGTSRASALAEGVLRAMLIRNAQRAALALLLCGLAGTAAGRAQSKPPVDQTATPPPAGRTVVAGTLTMHVHRTRTAHLFHVVDQLSSWSPFCHAQYRRWFEAEGGGLSDADRAMLAEHVAVRRARGWGDGLEQTFYTEAGLDAALKDGVASGRLTAEQAAVESRVLTHFAPRVDRLMADGDATLAAFSDRLAADTGALASFTAQAGRFFGRPTVDVPVYLIANPAPRDFGGGFNGGRLTLEVPTAYDAFPTFFHELFHAYIETKKPKLEAAIRGVRGLDVETLHEGLAYAMSPGILHPEAGRGAADPLRDRVGADLAGKKYISDPYVRFNRLGLAIRPILADALSDPSQTFETFLPRAVDAWRTVEAFSVAMETPPLGEKARTLFSFGPASRVLWDRFAASGYPLFGYNHRAEHYEAALARARPGDALILLMAADNPDRAVPEPFRDLCPLPWGEVEAACRGGKTVEVAGSARGLETVLLVAPTRAELEALIRKTAAIR